MNFREMTLDDLDGVEKIEKEIFSSPWSYKNLKDDLENDNAYYYVLEIDKKIIGYGGLWIMFDNCDLVKIGITTAYQGKGYGEKLLNLIIKEAILKQCEFMHLEVATNNIKAYHLYNKKGFIKTRLRKDYYGKNKDCIDMVKGLLGLDEKDFSD